MNTILLALLLVQDKTYDLKLNPSRQTGQRFQQDADQHMKMMMTANGQPVPGKEEKKLFSGMEEVVSANAEGAYELLWTFQKAQRLEGGEMKPFGFEGKTVRVKRAGKDAEKVFAYADGSPVADADLKGLKDSFDGSGKGDMSKALAPPKPVKVGESWTPDVMAVAATFEKGMAEAVDPAKSKGLFTLKSVQVRDGVEFGQIEGTMEFHLGAMGPLKLKTPIVMKITAELDARLDGVAPAGVMKVKGEMKGLSEAQIQDQTIAIDLDMVMTGTKSKSLLK